MFKVKDFANFKDRASRSEFWLSALLIAIIYSVIQILEGGFGSAFFANMFLLIMLIPLSAVGVRRFHDVGKSGALFLIALIVIPISLIGIGVVALNLIWGSSASAPIELVFAGIGVVLLILIFFLIKLLAVLCRKGDLDKNNYGFPVHGRINGVSD